MLKVLIDYPRPDGGVRDRRAHDRSARLGRTRVGRSAARRAPTGRRRGLRRPTLVEYAVKLSNATRDLGSVGLGELADYVTYGASPRASINMILAGRALRSGTRYALAQDLQEIAHDVLRHRLVLSYQALGDEIGPTR